MTHLQFTELQLTIVLSAIHVASLFSFVGGLLYNRIGARKTVCLGAALSSLCYVSLAILVRTRSSHSFPAVIVLSVIILWSAFFVFSSSMATVAAQFPKKQRGRIMAFQSATLGMSAGVIGLLQSAFFSSISKTENLLYFVAGLTSLPIMIALTQFPGHNSAVEPLQSDDAERTSLLDRQEDAITSTCSDSDGLRMPIAYTIAIAIFVVLQVGAVATWKHTSSLRLPEALVTLYPFLPTNVRVEVLCAFILLMLLACFMCLPLNCWQSNNPILSNEFVDAEDRHSDMETSDRSQMPLIEAVRDFRLHLLIVVFFVIPGSGATTVLVQVSSLAASRLFPAFTNMTVPPMLGTGESVSVAVQALIVAFGSCSMLGRLASGFISDIGKTSKQRESWTLRVLEIVSLIMGAGMLGVAVASGWSLVLAVGVVGYAHGTFSALVPSLVSTWFGVDGFPLYFAIGQFGVSFASLSTASLIPLFVSDLIKKYSWVDIESGVEANHAQRFCNGTMCFAPTFAVNATMCLSLFLVLRLCHKKILSTA